MPKPSAFKLARKRALVSVMPDGPQAQYVRVTAPFVYTESEIAAVLCVPPEAVRAWLRRGDLRPIALTSEGRSLFAVRDVEAIGRRLAAGENVRILRPAPRSSTKPRPGGP